MMYKYTVFAICAVISANSGAANAQGNQFVGFSASLEESESLRPGQTIKYNNVITNAGNHYNRATGVFTAPRTAYYMFHIYAVSHGPTGFWLQLMYNGIPQVSCSGDSKDTFAAGGNSVLLKVKAGGRVYVEALLASELYGHETQHYTTFTGQLSGL
ncbi:hypothetical protein BsWGS_25980 [Bradybaena similaris]